MKNGKMLPEFINLSFFLSILFSTQTKPFVLSQLNRDSASTAVFVFDEELLAEQGYWGPTAPVFA